MELLPHIRWLFNIQWIDSGYNQWHLDPHRGHPTAAPGVDAVRRRTEGAAISRRASSALRLHSKGSVQTDHLSVQHGVLHDRLDQVSVLVRIAQSAGEGDLLGQELPRLLREAHQERGRKQA